MINDPLANTLSLIMNYEKIGKSECIIRPVSKVIKQVLKVMNESGYIGQFVETKDNKGGFLTLDLLGMVNNCGVIKPRYSSKKGDFEKYEKMYLPSKNVGILIVSTTKGILTHTESKKKGLGGRLIAYCF